MKKRFLVVLVGLLLGLAVSPQAQAGCPKGSIMVAGGAPGYPSHCLHIDPIYNFIN